MANCLECENNVMGECQLCGREIPYYYVYCKSRPRPTWCPELVEQRFWDYIDDKNDEKRLEAL